MRLGLACACALALLFPPHTATIATAEDAGEVNVYSYRQPDLINPLFKAFTEQASIKRASELVDKVGFDDGPSS